MTSGPTRPNLIARCPERLRPSKLRPFCIAEPRPPLRRRSPFFQARDRGEARILFSFRYQQAPDRSNRGTYLRGCKCRISVFGRNHRPHRPTTQCPPALDRRVSATTSAHHCRPGRKRHHLSIARAHHALEAFAGWEREAVGAKGKQRPTLLSLFGWPPANARSVSGTSSLADSCRQSDDLAEVILFFPSAGSGMPRTAAYRWVEPPMQNLAPTIGFIGLGVMGA